MRSFRERLRLLFSFWERAEGRLGDEPRRRIKVPETKEKTANEATKRRGRADDEETKQRKENSKRCEMGSYEEPRSAP